jgi:hypothetical protein
MIGWWWLNEMVAVAVADGSSPAGELLVMDGLEVESSGEDMTGLLSAVGVGLDDFFGLAV